jgi:transporter family-2 protein
MDPICFMVITVQHIGTVLATVAVIFAQLTMSVLIDNFGWLGNEAITRSNSRMGTLVCLAIALYFIHSSSKAEVKEAHN